MARKPSKYLISRQELGAIHRNSIIVEEKQKQLKESRPLNTSFEVTYYMEKIKKLRNHHTLSELDLEELQCYLEGLLERVKLERSKINGKE